MIIKVDIDLGVTVVAYVGVQKYRKGEYVQRPVCFVNVQFPWPNSNIYVKLWASRLCMKMASFLFVSAWGMQHI